MLHETGPPSCKAKLCTMRSCRIPAYALLVFWQNYQISQCSADVPLHGVPCCTWHWLPSVETIWSSHLGQHLEGSERSGACTKGFEEIRRNADRYDIYEVTRNMIREQLVWIRAHYDNVDVGEDSKAWHVHPRSGMLNQQETHLRSQGATFQRPDAACKHAAGLMSVTSEQSICTSLATLRSLSSMLDLGRRLEY